MTKLTKDKVRTLFAESGKDLVRFLSRRLPDSEDAKDLAQEAYLRLLRLDKEHIVRDPEAYLFRIASNLVHEHWLKGRRKEIGNKEEIEPDALPSFDEPPEIEAARRQAIVALERALRVLPRLQQQTLLLHRRDGMTYDEIADQLGVSPHMVKKYLTKGLARCREQMRRYDYEQ